MMHRTLCGIMILGLAALAGACSKKGDATCSYSVNPGDIKLEWTGYKFNNKTGATGSFPNAKVAGPTSAGSLPELMKGLSFSADASTVSTGNPGRDVTIQEFFFGKLIPPFQISAVPEAVQGDDKQGTLSIKITMNSKTQLLPFSYTGDPAAGTLEAKGSIDILQEFGGQTAFDSLHQACESLHIGEDGVAKTWSTVDLKLSGKYSKNCK